MRISKLLILFIISFSPLPCSGAIVTYSFQGTVQSSIGLPFGLSIPGGTSVSGQFSYDTASAGTVVSGSATKYLQHQTDGLIAYFGAHEIRASDYLVTVSNNLTSPNRDQFDISFRSTDSLLSGKSLFVNDNELASGTRIFVVGLPFPNTEFSGPSLPLSLDPTHLTPITSSSTLSSGPALSFVTIQSITQVINTIPEPGSCSLAIAALAGSIAWLRMNIRRRV